MYSFTLFSIAWKLARIATGIRNVVRITNGSEMPSTPRWKRNVPPSHGRFSTNWNSGLPRSKPEIRKSDTRNVAIVVHSAT